MKKSLLWMLVLVVSISMILAFSVGGCKASEEAAPAEEEVEEATPEKEAETPAEEGKYKYGIAQINFSLPFFATWYEEQEKASEEYDFETVWKSCEGSLEQQLADLESFIEMDVDVIQLNPIDNVGIESAVEKVVKAGIPIFSGANVIDVPGNVNALLPEYDIFVDIADMVAAYLNYEGNVCLLVGQVGNWASDHRQAGFIDTIKNYPDINLLSWQPADWDASKAAEIAEGWLTSYDDLDVIVSVSDGEALAMLEVIKTAGRDEVKIFSHGGEPEGLEAVKEGGYISNTLLSAERYTWWTTQVAYRVLKGEKFEDDSTWMPVPLVFTEETYEKLKENEMERLEELEWATPDEAVEAIANAGIEFSK